MSLRARLLLLVLVSSIGPLLALLLLLMHDREAQHEAAKAELARQAQAIAQTLDGTVAGTGQLLFGLARAPVITEGHRGACSDFLAAVLQEHPQYTGLLTILPDGQLYCDSLRTGRKLDLRDRRYFQQALQANEPVIEPAIGRLTGKPVLQIAYPVRSTDGALQTVLLASLDYGAYMGALNARWTSPGTRVQLWNKDGSVVLDHAPNGAQATATTAAEAAFVLNAQADAAALVRSDTPDPVASRVWAVAPLPHFAAAGLRVALQVPEEALGAEADQRYRHLLIGLALLGLTVFGCAAWFGEITLRRQALRVLRGVARLSAGVFDKPIGAPYPRGELGEVMASVDAMAISLARERDTLRDNARTLKRQAEEDPLTGLANWHRLTLRLEQAMEIARCDGHHVGVMMLDLDRFKTVNDSLGHMHGDVLLKAIARRLQHAVGAGDTVARLGGDEFVVVIAEVQHTAQLDAIARRVLAAFAEPVAVEQHLLPVSTSLGISVYPNDGNSVDLLLRHADAAMYRAKDEGGNNLAFFTLDMMHASVERLHTETGLRQALERRELVVHLQPIIDATGQHIVSAEALVRWQHPEHGLVPPAQFIPIAEETGLIVPIGDWVLREACTIARRWQHEGRGDIPIAVNLSPRQFSVPNLDLHVASVLQETGCAAHLLQLEITESTMMKHADQALETLHRLKALGVQLSIDDFGTGYSSLSQLKRLPVDKLKIDRSFVRDIPTDPQDAVIVDTIVALARKLDLQVIAEGVETAEQRDFLQRLGCDEYQGYLFSRPCAVDQFEQLIEHREVAA